MASMGMIQVAGTTYRIVRAGTAYEVYRVLDDMRVGSFRYLGRVELLVAELDATTLRSVAVAAVREGKLDWSVASGPAASVKRGLHWDFSAAWQDATATLRAYVLRRTQVFLLALSLVTQSAPPAQATRGHANASVCETRVRIVPTARGVE